MEPMDADD
jgi:hypothetical protein